MPRHYFLIKSEPYKYSFSDLIRDGRTVWDGVRNFEARNNLRAMKKGDQLLFYHSNEGKEVVGIAAVEKTAYADATAPDEDWSVIELKPIVALSEPVTLDAIRNEPKLQDIQLLRRSRLSVVPVTAKEFAQVLKMGRTALPKASA
jgi:predicted RNA-binding protein with PUA-like domain